MCLISAWCCREKYTRTPKRFFFPLIVCFTSYFVFSIAVLPHSPGEVHCHLLLRQETRIPGVAPFSFLIGIWDLLVHRGQKSYIPTAFGKLWTKMGARCIIHDFSMTTYIFKVFQWEPIQRGTPIPPLTILTNKLILVLRPIDKSDVPACTSRGQKPIKWAWLSHHAPCCQSF